MGGERACADRYQAIKRVLSMLPTPFTLLDFGANAGYFARRTVEDFDAVATAVDDHRGLPAAASENLVVVNKRLDVNGMRMLPRHDVALALSVLHHIADWPRMLDQIRACRQFAVIEVPHPDERWMRSAAARHQLREIHDTVAGLASARLGTFQRTGRDGSNHARPMFLVPGTLERIEGTVFSGSGTCGRKLTPALHGRGLDRELGYQPFPGSLNLRLDVDNDALGDPHIDWPGTVNGKKRPYWFWPAWVDGLACHAMIPATRGHGPNHVELVAPVRLRDQLDLNDGDTLMVDVARG
jgi:riboflavin kinase